MSTKAERRAAKLLRDHGVIAPAVDVQALAAALDIAVQYERFTGEMSGVLLIENGTASVAINESHHHNRQRFTLAHEIGHVLLHAGEDRVFVDRRFFRNAGSSKGELREEIEANAFAASLLMPRHFVRQCIEQYFQPGTGITDLDVFRLATRFEVSEQAMTLRLVKLGYIEPD